MSQGIIYSSRFFDYQKMIIFEVNFILILIFDNKIIRFLKMSEIMILIMPMYPGFFILKNHDFFHRFLKK